MIPTAKGLTRKTSGGAFNIAQYIQVGISKKGLEGVVAFGDIKLKNIEFLAAKLSLVQKLNRDKENQLLLYKDLESTGYETSHLCHSTTGCWRPDHLTEEDHRTNVARNSQFGCAGWFWFTDAQELVCFCAQPRCEFVRYRPKNGFTVDSAPSSQ